MRLQIADRERFVDNALTMLRELDFEPAWVDRDRGLIQTRPTTSAQWYEFWRGDVIGPDQALESSVSTVRRSVRVDIGPPPIGEAASTVDVEVRKERYSAPERQVTTASSALAIYSERLPTSEGLIRARTAGEHWVDLGRDGRLERDLLRRMSRLPSARKISEGQPAAPKPAMAPAPDAPASTAPEPERAPPAPTAKPSDVIEMEPIPD